ncbi:MarR family winged helix-turn-helix transcriptional regulator [Aeromicrobium choanae]|uniref:DNA-binding transcriptional regulator, MarR family n=1 Tax=Aeromicrobium choanae TaxID=1736691 RepID=A0A1T4Z4B9_9ACTN|nr:MarR family transcriptional regulator [Aeromicrobium choanae]SKB08892.1 DNA-binding transcriptional regulator, MarR family [Aeromicrobium choanae]
MTAATSTPATPLEDQLCYSIYSAGMAIQRMYKPLLDELGLTYPQYLVLSVLWREDEQTVSALASSLALESSTLTPLLKRLEAGGLLTRRRNPSNERQVIVALTPQGDALRERAGCLGSALLESSGRTPEELAQINEQIRSLRDTIYATASACTWDAPI